MISVVGSLLAFNQFFIITDGGPGTSTQSIVMQIYETFNANFNVGTASAMSIVLVVVVGFITFSSSASCEQTMPEHDRGRERTAPPEAAGGHGALPRRRDDDQRDLRGAAPLGDACARFRQPGEIVARPSLKSFSHLGLGNYTTLFRTTTGSSRTSRTA